MHDVVFSFSSENVDARVESDLPAFFSWRVISFQFSFMRSRSDIHNSACSCSGMPSHRFSMLLRVGFEMAWVEAARAAIDVGRAEARTMAALRSRLELGMRYMVGELREVGRRGDVSN